MDPHKTQLHSLLVSSQFEDQENALLTLCLTIIFGLFTGVTALIQKAATLPCTIPSRTSPKSNFTEDLDYVPEEAELLHKDLKKAVHKRDDVCLFCWDKLECEGAHIIAQMTYDESSLLQRAGLTQKHQRYVDVVDDKLVIKVINEANDETSEKHRDWKIALGKLKNERFFMETTEANGEMAFYFKCLEVPQDCCMIWRMAGGTETDEEYCSDDEDLGAVDTAALKRRIPTMSSNNWIPLESNPEVLNEYLHKLGINAHHLCFQDVYGLDEELLSMIPAPVKSLILLFPITPQYEGYRKALLEYTKERPVAKDIFFTQQTIGNACGTIGLIHSLANCLDDAELGDGVFKSTIKTLLPLKPEDRASALEKSDEFAKVHESAAVQGQTAAPSPDDDVDLHFVCFVAKEGYVYELDGRNPRPINHGRVGAGSTFVLEAAKVIQNIMALTPDAHNFTILAYAGLP